MSWLKSILGGGSQPAPKPERTLTLATLRRGDMVDFDLESWLVGAQTRLEYGEGPGVSRWADDWELSSGTRKIRLHRDKIGGDAHLHVLEAMELDAIDTPIRDEVVNAGDPPAQIYVQGEPFFRDHECFAGFMHREDRTSDGLIYWIYKGVHPGAEIRVEQVGEFTVRAFVRQAVQEHQFSNLLPGS